MRRGIIVVFIIVAAILAYIFLSKTVFEEEAPASRYKVVVPVVDGTTSSEDTGRNDYSDDFLESSFITLANDETLISTVTIDIDSDGYDDQVNIIRTSSSSYLVLIVALYNSKTSQYERTVSLPTSISQSKTFMCTGMDVLGNHRKQLVYQGVDDNGNSVLKIFDGVKTRKGEFILNLVGDFETDGTVFIQQVDRSESYELSRTRDVCYPIWIYASDTQEGASKLDQIQAEYNYSDSEKKYVLVRQVKVAGSRIEASALAKIQDGTVETFVKFLDGLWYKTESKTGAFRFIFFDSLNNEIIFQYEDSEEVYAWLNSSIRRNGIYFSSVNKSIENLQRRFDISLVSVDEVRVKIQDDVRMIIGESTLWDGNYKKMTSDSIIANANTEEKNVIDTLKEGVFWATTDGVVIHFDDEVYTASRDDYLDSGRFKSFVISGTRLIQIKSESDKPVLDGVYALKFPVVEVKKATAKQKAVTDFDRDTVIMQKVVVNPEGFYFADTVPVTLHKYEEKGDGQISFN